MISTHGPLTAKSAPWSSTVVIPDGLEFEVAWVVPADLLDADALAARERIGPLDLAREQDRYGPDTKGGTSASRSRQGPRWWWEPRRWWARPWW